MNQNRYSLALVRWAILLQVLIGFFFYGIMKNHNAEKYGPFKTIADCNTIRTEMVAAYSVAGILYIATSCFEDPK